MRWVMLTAAMRVLPHYFMHCVFAQLVPKRLSIFGVFAPSMSSAVADPTLEGAGSSSTLPSPLSAVRGSKLRSAD